MHYNKAGASLQVTTLMSRHDKALAQGLVSGQQLEHLQQQVLNQGSLLRSAKEAAKASDTQEAKEQVTSCICRRLKLVYELEAK